jgi:hypothetical protein
MISDQSTRAYFPILDSALMYLNTEPEKARIISNIITKKKDKLFGVGIERNILKKDERS